MFATTLDFLSRTGRKVKERGQGTLEYLGIAIVALILVGAVIGALGNGDKVKNAISGTIDDIIAKKPGGGDGSGDGK